ncbi:MAG: response regulator transcription factor [Myxococcota bacterium]
MWILVVGRESHLERSDGAASILRDLGCRIRVADFWDPLHEDPPASPPAAVVIEAVDEAEAARGVLTRIRKDESLRGVPVVAAVSTRGLSGLDARDAFDDVVLVPYVPAELYLRIRRVEWRNSDFVGEERIKVGSLLIDTAAHEVEVAGRTIELTHQEFLLLRFLVENRDRVFTREQLLSRVWGVDYYGGSRTVDIHVRRLRKKLEGAAKLIQTVRGVGYKVRAP